MGAAVHGERHVGCSARAHARGEIADGCAHHVAVAAGRGRNNRGRCHGQIRRNVGLQAARVHRVRGGRNVVGNRKRRRFVRACDGDVEREGPVGRANRRAARRANFHLRAEASEAARNDGRAGDLDEIGGREAPQRVACNRRRARRWNGNGCVATRVAHGLDRRARKRRSGCRCARYTDQRDDFGARQERIEERGRRRRAALRFGMEFQLQRSGRVLPLALHFEFVGVGLSWHQRTRRRIADRDPIPERRRVEHDVGVREVGNRQAVGGSVGHCRGDRFTPYVVGETLVTRLVQDGPHGTLAAAHQRGNHLKSDHDLRLTRDTRDRRGERIARQAGVARGADGTARGDTGGACFKRRSGGRVKHFE